MQMGPRRRAVRAPLTHTHHPTLHTRPSQVQQVLGVLRGRAVVVGSVGPAARGPGGGLAWQCVAQRVGGGRWPARPGVPLLRPAPPPPLPEPPIRPPWGPPPPPLPLHPHLSSFLVPLLRTSRVAPSALATRCLSAVSTICLSLYITLA
jgi:hypothetical protein